MPDPISSNLISNTCGDIISSNCVPWGGPDFPCLKVCKGASITDVITSLANKVCNTGSCYTDTWVDFSSNIPASGTGTNCSFTVSGFASFSGQAGFPVISTDNPMYKWTADQDIKLRGSVNISLTTTSGTGYCYIPLASLSSSCIPSSFIAAQVVLLDTDVIQIDKYSSPPGEGGINFMKAYLVANPSGLLQLLVTFDFVQTDTVSYSISLGGVNLNLS